jgi:hypothetical protein
MSSVSHARLGSEFEKFLYAPIGQDNNGMPLSVLSALARQDVDPWEEAARLAQLPQEKAVTQLVSLLGAFPHAPLACPDPASAATRLITLLPRPRDHVHASVNLFAQTIPAKHPAAVPNLIFVLTYTILMLFSIWLISRLQTPGQLESPSTPTADAISQPPTPSESR